MPELPEVETIKRGLARTIVGKTIAKVDVRLPKIISLGPGPVSNVRKNSRTRAKQFEKLLAGQKVVKVQRRAKMLIVKFFPSLEGRGKGRVKRRPHQSPPPNLPPQGGGMGEGAGLSLLIHFKMTGQLIFVKKNERKLMKIFNVVGSRRLLLPHQYTHVIFHFRGGSKLYYNDLRQFGYLRLVPDEKVGEVRELREYGPEPFSREFTLDYLKQKARGRPRLAVKLFLMDPRVVAGIGNIYSDEILYCARVRPVRPVRSLTQKEWRRLFACIPKILKEALRRRGSSVGDYFQVDGSEGTYGRAHRVYGRGGQKCRKCGSIISTVKLGGRTASHCPKCQK